MEDSCISKDIYKKLISKNVKFNKILPKNTEVFYTTIKTKKILKM